MEQWFDFEAASVPAEEVREARKGSGGVIGGGIYMAGSFGGRYRGGAFGAGMTLGRDISHAWGGAGGGSASSSGVRPRVGSHGRGVVAARGRMIGAQRIHMTLAEPTTKGDASKQNMAEKGNVVSSASSVTEEGSSVEVGGTETEEPVLANSNAIDGNGSSGAMEGIEIANKDENTKTTDAEDVEMAGSGNA